MSIYTFLELGDFEFEWDGGNIGKNLRKHGVADFEAEEAFFDERVLVLPDLEHAAVEERFHLTGSTRQGRLLLLAFTIRENRIRVISARDASRGERANYEKEA